MKLLMRSLVVVAALLAATTSYAGLISERHGGYHFLGIATPHDFNFDRLHDKGPRGASNFKLGFLDRSNRYDLRQFALLLKYKVFDGVKHVHKETPTPGTSVPEPGTLALLGAGLAGLGLLRRRRAAMRG